MLIKQGRLLLVIIGSGKGLRGSVGTNTGSGVGVGVLDDTLDPPKKLVVNDDHVDDGVSMHGLLILVLPGVALRLRCKKNKKNAPPMRNTEPPAHKPAWLLLWDPDGVGGVGFGGVGGGDGPGLGGVGDGDGGGSGAGQYALA